MASEGATFHDARISRKGLSADGIFVAPYTVAILRTTVRRVNCRVDDTTTLPDATRAPSGVHLNLVAPGPIDTGMLDRFTGTPEKKVWPRRCHSVEK